MRVAEEGSARQARAPLRASTCDVLPRWAKEADPDEAIDEERIRGMSANERLAELVEIWALMESILRGRSDRELELARRDPIPDGWMAIIDRRAREAG